MRHTTILVADDDPAILRLLTKTLTKLGYVIIAAHNGEEALDLVITTKPDLLILDLMMPHMDGFEVIQRVRAFSQLPILILTARGLDEEKVQGLDLGADDYLTKPFHLNELAARVRVALRRSEQSAFIGLTDHQPVVSYGKLRVDFAAQQVTLDGRDIPLTPLEFRLFSLLVRHPGRVITQDALLTAIWGPGTEGEIHLLQVGINRLRRKLETEPTQHRFIRTRAGIGYQFDPDQASPLSDDVAQESR